MRFCRWLALCIPLACVPAHAVGPQRVVSADLCSDEYVFRFVPRERIVALSWLAGDRSPVVSTIADKVEGIALLRPSAEAILTLAPDLVAMSTGTNPRLRSQLAAAHIAILEIPPAESLSQVRAVTRTLGVAFDARARADALLDEMDRALRAGRSQGAPVTALIYEPNGYASSGAFADEIMAAAGLSDAAPGLHRTRSGTIPVEAVIATPPELLILGRTTGRAHSEAELVLRHPAFAALNGRTSVASLALTPLLCPGPWSADLVPVLARLGQRALARRPARP